ncbi:MAG TPA: nitrate/sulfonate/bicarbonate ABC transporter ATP-binding protein [Stellaceae bacterium]|jgi:NitT/TauT family transport system ATP-binding protein|nr:nitrate/sulfonate/bicarbonate ABC transporter ATP-binding protein [Stellaceae bacterium]
MTVPLLRTEAVSKTYRMPDHLGRLVLDHLDFTLGDGEIVAILGKSGSGKSTFLRILAGLVPPSDGAVEYRGHRVSEPVRGIAMVFQSYALFPWLTVLGNVELGLEALGVSSAERRRRAVDAIDVIGLDGFETAYPKELSGGMRQRVGFARALVVDPDILLLDEPFSSLDVLTAETLRGDLLDLWDANRIPTKGIVMVSHNIEEAVEVADRILIFSSDPGRIRADIPIALPRPRTSESAGFRQIVDQVYTLLTTMPGRDGRRGARPEPIGIGYRLPDASVQQLSGLIDSLTEAPYHGRADLPQLADEENLVMDELFPLIETLQLLGLANVSAGDIELTALGRAYAEADMLARKQLFAEAVLKHIPLAAHIRRVLDERPGHRAPAARFLRELEDHLSESEAQRVLDTVINWGRHAEIFSYDSDTEVLSLENF